MVLVHCSTTCPLVARYARVAHDASTGMCRPIYEDGCQTVLWSKWHQWIITIMVNTSKSVLFCMKNVLHEEDCPPVGNPDIHRGLKMMKMIPANRSCVRDSFIWMTNFLQIFGGPIMVTIILLLKIVCRGGWCTKANPSFVRDSITWMTNLLHSTDRSLLYPVSAESDTRWPQSYSLLIILHSYMKTKMMRDARFNHFKLTNLTNNSESCGDIFFVCWLYA